MPGYSGIDDSFFVHAATKELEPIQAKTLKDFTNSVHENFFGSNIIVTKLVDKDTGKERILSKHKQTMGPIMLEIENLNLMDAWEDASFSEVADFKAGLSETCVNENWIKDPPNVLIFNLNRVKYDTKSKSVIKDCRKFTFEKLIYVD
jgi:hypothetical protein